MEGRGNIVVVSEPGLILIGGDKTSPGILYVLKQKELMQLCSYVQCMNSKTLYRQIKILEKNC